VPGVREPERGDGSGSNTVTPALVRGDLLDQEVEVIVNAWNRNIIPWWLLLPQGVSGTIKRKGGLYSDAEPWPASSSLTVTKRSPFCRPAVRIPSRASSVFEGSGMPSWRTTMTPGDSFLVTSHSM